MLDRQLDRKGQRFGKLKVIAMAERLVKPTKSYARCVCRCDCGAIVTVLACNLVEGRTVSCGCHRARVTALLGMSSRSSPEYRAWANMKDRCRNPRNRRYSDWGGRGIRVCRRWDRFAAFFADMGKRPSGKTLERINNDGHYEPSNCRWATAAEQAKNRRTASTILTQSEQESSKKPEKP